MNETAEVSLGAGSHNAGFLLLPELSSHPGVRCPGSAPDMPTGSAWGGPGIELSHRLRDHDVRAPLRGNSVAAGATFRATLRASGTEKGTFVKRRAEERREEGPSPSAFPETRLLREVLTSPQ